MLKYAMLGLTLFLAACGKKADYAVVVPTDVDFVAMLDCKRIFTESGLLVNDSGEQQSEIHNLLKKKSRKEHELFQTFLSNPNEVGIDWSQRAYVFEQSQSNVKVCVLPVLDKEKLRTSILDLAGSQIRGGKFYEEDGYLWASGRHYNIAINEKVCIIIPAVGRERVEGLKARVSTWLTQEENASFVSTKYHEMLQDQDGEVGIYASMSSLPENASFMASMAYSEDMDINTIKYLADISFGDGKLTANGKLLYEDSAMKE